MASFFVSLSAGDHHDQNAKLAHQRWCRYKHARTVDTIHSDWYVATLMDAQPDQASFFKREDGSWMVCAGTWIHKGNQAPTDLRTLLEIYLQFGAEKLARELEGVFSFLICDARNKSVVVMTDPMGSLHTYLRQTPQGIWVSTSSIALSDSAKLDPVGLAEYLATGIIYEDRSLWADVRKLAPATITVIRANQLESSVYWRIAEALEPRLSLPDAAEQLMAQLVASLKKIGDRFQPCVSDLTGGYDSRLLLCGLLESRIPFQNTVAGDPDSGDVVTAKAIARKLELQLIHYQNNQAFSLDRFDQAVRLSDGEYNAFDYARILDSQAPLSAQFTISLNGSYGEVARGYWWELLWPHMDKTQPIDADLIARKRFAAVPHVDLMKPKLADTLATHMAGVIRRTAAPYAAYPLGSQMDVIYLTMRMQRWQGRISSNTNQIWPSVSPLGFTNVLSPILASVPAARFRSLMPRHIFSKWNPTLANIPLEHGYPPAVATPANILRFAPLISSYGGKVAQKVRARLPGGRKTMATMSPKPYELYPDLLRQTDSGLLQASQLLSSNLLDEDMTLNFLSSAGPLTGGLLEQWQRLVSLEYTLQNFKALGQ